LGHAWTWTVFGYGDLRSVFLTCRPQCWAPWCGNWHSWHCHW